MERHRKSSNRRYVRRNWKGENVLNCHFTEPLCLNRRHFRHFYCRTRPRSLATGVKTSPLPSPLLFRIIQNSTAPPSEFAEPITAGFVAVANNVPLPIIFDGRSN